MMYRKDPMGTFVAVMLASSMACVVTAIGVFIVNRYSKWVKKQSVHFMSFAAGMLISVSFLHIIPESFEMNARSPAFLLAGFLGLYLSNRLLTMYACHEHGPDCPDQAKGITPALGIGFHSLVDGIIYAVTFSVSVFTGVLAATGMVLHEFPEGVITYMLLQRGGFDRKRAAIYALLAAGFSTPLGTLISYPFLHRLSQPALGALLAASAGALVYVGASHLLPAIEEEGKKYALLSLAAGVLTAVGIVLVGH
jgi:zinc and cadmium transporter